MRALTIKQPWAECIAAGVKTVENRSRNINYRGPLLVHAGLGWCQRGAASPVVQHTLWPGAGRLDPTATGFLGAGLPAGKILALTELVDCHPAVGCCQPWGEETGHHLILANIRRLPEPIPAQGAPRLWKPAPEVLAQIEEAAP